MSSKSSLVLTEKNEHWYYDCSDDTFVLEFDTDTSICEELIQDEKEYQVIIKKGTPLWLLLDTLQRGGTIYDACKKHKELV